MTMRITVTLLLLAFSYSLHAEEKDELPPGLAGFGAGLGLTIDTGSRTRVDSASITDGIVRIDDDSDVLPRFLFETHAIFRCSSSVIRKAKREAEKRLQAMVADATKGRLVDMTEDELTAEVAANATVAESDKRAIMADRAAIQEKNQCAQDRLAGGLFVAAGLGGNNQVIEALGAGWMWRIPDSFNGHPINVGIGYMVDKDVQVLGDGFIENEPPPGNETQQVRLRKTDQGGVLITVSVEIGKMGGT